MNYKKCIIHFKNGKTYLLELAEETTIEEMCYSILPIYDYYNEDDC